jgi:hypothetical protein
MTRQTNQIADSHQPNRTRWVLLLGLVLTIATGVVYGRLTLRWGTPADMVAAGKHLQTLPKEFGDWQMVAEEPLDQPVIEALQCAGYVTRRYVNRRDGDTVTLFIVVGPPGPISVHTPEVCYSGRDYDTSAEREEVTLTGSQSRSHAFWGLTLEPKNVTADQLRVYYAWTTDGTWVASTRNRYKYALSPMLFKLQLAGAILPSEISGGKDPCRDFLTDLVALDWTPTGT